MKVQQNHQVTWGVFLAISHSPKKPRQIDNDISKPHWSTQIQALKTFLYNPGWNQKMEIIRMKGANPWTIPIVSPISLISISKWGLWFQNLPTLHDPSIVRSFALHPIHSIAKPCPVSRPSFSQRFASPSRGSPSVDTVLQLPTKHSKEMHWKLLSTRFH